jgi:hypothetical protein
MDHIGGAVANNERQPHSTKAGRGFRDDNGHPLDFNGAGPDHRGAQDPTTKHLMPNGSGLRAIDEFNPSNDRNDR